MSTRGRSTLIWLNGGTRARSTRGVVGTSIAAGAPEGSAKKFTLARPPCPPPALPLPDLPSRAPTHSSPATTTACRRKAVPNPEARRVRGSGSPSLNSGGRLGVSVTSIDTHTTIGAQHRAPLHDPRPRNPRRLLRRGKAAHLS